MRLLSWNVNGIRAVHKKGFVDWVKEAKPEILCLQETKAQPEQIPAGVARSDDHGFVVPPEGGVGVWGVGCARRPVEVAGSVRDATAGALRAIRTSQARS